jgi:hypothetical protein
MLTIVPFRRVDAFAGQATVPESLDLERLFRQRLARRPGTNDDNKSPLLSARRTKISSPDPPLTTVCTAYATPPLPFSHPPIELASWRPGRDLHLDGRIDFSAIHTVVIIRWPEKPCVIHPRRFPDTAAVVARLFAEAATRLAAIKASRPL